MQVIILAGGSGERLWPLSNRKSPKQALSLNDTGTSIFQETLERIKGIIPPGNIIVVTNKDQVKILKTQAWETLRENCIFLIEPVAKNTAPAIGLALFYLYQKDPSGVVVALPSDHLISPKEKFIELLKQAEKISNRYNVVTFGIAPDRPETGYGYIETGKEIEPGIFRVEKFQEKPDLEKAKEFIGKGNYLWNSGMFVFSKEKMVEQFKKNLPIIKNLLGKIDYENFGNLEEIYHKINGVSFDHGIMEKIAESAVIKANLKWSDVGDWKAIYDLLNHDAKGNHFKGNIVSYNVKNSLVWGTDKIIGVVGLENLILVDTPNGLLVCNREYSQEIKKITPIIKEMLMCGNKREIRDFLWEQEKEEWLKCFKNWLAHSEAPEDLFLEINGLSEGSEIKDRFEKNLEFGTGGVRGKLGFGTNRFNKRVVGRITQGLINHLNSKQTEGEKTIVVGYDTRETSKGFAEEAAMVLAGNNYKVHLFELPCPTPIISYTTRKLTCQAGIVITGSHNSLDYNGYKVYSKDGVQILPGQAQEIAGEIKRVNIFEDIVKIDMEKAIENGRINFLGEEITADFFSEISSQFKAFSGGAKKLKIAYSPLHGTGNNFVRRALKKDGFNVNLVSKPLIPTPEKAKVRSLNPEDFSAYGVAIEKAKETDSDIILVTDLDGDRIGCMAKKSPGKYIFLTGNQIGALIVDYLLKYKKENNDLPKNGVIIKTIVTNNLGKEIASSYGIDTLETLTGFKFIGEKIKDIERNQESQFLFGYEESYGYLARNFLRDKDAISSALLIARCAEFWKERGISLVIRLEELFKKHGYFKEDLVKIDLDKNDKDVKQKVMQVFRDLVKEKEFFEEMKIKQYRDYLSRKGFKTDSQETFQLELPESDTLFFQLDGESWACLRPSGTEPILKLYFGVREKNKEEAYSKLEELKKSFLKKSVPF